MISFSYCLGIKAKPHPPLLTLLKLKNGSGVRTLVSCFKCMMHIVIFSNNFSTVKEIKYLCCIHYIKIFVAFLLFIMPIHLFVHIYLHLLMIHLFKITPPTMARGSRELGNRKS